MGAPLRPRLRHLSLLPAVPVPAERVAAACEVLRQQELSVWRRLYREGLTEPGFPAAPFGVRRSIEFLGCLEIIPSGYEEYRFLATSWDHPDKSLARAALLLEAINSGAALVDPRACCPAAKISGCVCLISFTCDVHGGRCHGTHD